MKKFPPTPRRRKPATTTNGDNIQNQGQVPDLPSSPLSVKSLNNNALAHIYTPRNLIPTSATGVQLRQAVLTEDEFIDKLEALERASLSRPVIISDSPGAGKSSVLAQLGKKIRQRFKDKTVLCLAMRDFVNTVKKLEAADIVEQVLLKHMITYGGDFGLRAKLASNNSANKFELLLDGFDEVQVGSLEVAVDILKVIQESFNHRGRLWITTRPHLLRVLEKCLVKQPQVYTLEPWDTPSQKEFMVSYWSQDGNQQSLANTKLAYFAEDILDSFKQTMSATERAYFGCPILCQLIAEVFEKEATVISSSNTDVFEVNIPSSVAELYSRFVQKFFKEELQPYLMCKALQISFPQWTEEFSKILEPSFANGENSLNAVFIHRTIPEYFVARYIVHTLNELVTCDNLQFFHKFLWQILLDTEPVTLILHGLNNKWDFSLRHATATFKHSTICYFLDSMIETVVSIKFKFSNILIPPNNSTPGTNLHVAIQLRNLISACVYNDHEHLFRWLLAWISFKPYQSLVFDPSLVLTAACRSSLPLIKLVVMEYEQWNAKPLTHLRFRQHHGSDVRNFKVTLLHVALWRGYRPGVMYLLDKKGFRDFVILDSTSSTRMLLHDCVVRSMEQEDSVIEEKLEIIKTLLNMDRAVLEERDKHNQTPILGYRVHVRLLTELISLGAELFAVDKRGDTLLHLASHYLSSEDYHRLVTAIPDEKLDIMLKMKGKLKRTPLLEMVRHFDPMDITFEIFASHGAEFSVADEGGESVIDAARKSGRSVECIKTLTIYVSYEMHNSVKTGQKQRYCNVA